MPHTPFCWRVLLVGSKLDDIAGWVRIPIESSSRETTGEVKGDPLIEFEKVLSEYRTLEIPNLPPMPGSSFHILV